LLGEGDAGTKREHQGDTQSLNLHDGSSYGDLRPGDSIDGSRWRKLYASFALAL
jgi:hypothetical protein